MSCPRNMLRLAAVACLSTMVVSQAVAKDYVLTIGGGYSPQGNQISLEKNVLFFQQLLAEQKPEGVPHDIFFSDGDSPLRDLQYQSADQPVPKANQRMARIFGRENYLDLNYRNHQVPGVLGGTSREALHRWFQETGSKLQAGDRLLLYVTAHGGKSKDKQNEHNSRLFFWKSESIQASELAAHLNTLPHEVSVVVVMVQCYSGGFANLIFNEANPKQGFASGVRCGFFATIHSRPAAGCTADINEENYQEYSSFFWAALGGKTRTGQPIKTPDYDQDGDVSFDEAHAYTILTSQSIDIPVKTSGALLRAFSKTSSAGRDDLVQDDAPYDDLLALATPAEKAILAGLSEQLGLTGTTRTEAARSLAERIAQERDKLGETRKTKAKRFDTVKAEIQKDLKLRWPELANPFAPQVTRLLTAEAAEFVEAVDSHKKYSELSRLYNEVESLGTQRLELNRRWAKCQRFLRTVENIALAANLPKLANEDVQQHYRQIRAAEQSTLHTFKRAEVLAPAAGQ